MSMLGNSLFSAREIYPRQLKMTKQITGTEPTVYGRATRDAAYGRTSPFNLLNRVHIIVPDIYL